VRAAGLQADYRYAPGETIFARGLELFELAVERLFEDGQLPQYDAIVIDEAQDVLTTPIMNGLDLLLDNGFRSGTWLIFLDSAVQAGVYGRMDRRVLDFIRSLGPAQPTLRRNYRNPKNIVFEVSELLSIERPECRRIFNSNVEYRTFSSEREEGAKLRALVVDLLKSGVEPGSISILSGCATSRCSARRHNVASIARLSYLDEADASPSAGAISVATVSAFKGLENEVVILTDVPALRPLTEWGASVLYVGMTRARSKLFALVDQEFIDARAALSSTHQ
jgi:hypothetical protein